MTRVDLATFLQVTTRTVDNMRSKGLPTIMVGASPRFDVAAVKAWLQTQHEGERTAALTDSESLGAAIREFPDPHRVRGK